MSARPKILAHDGRVIDLVKNAYKYVSLYGSNNEYIYWAIYVFAIRVDKDFNECKKVITEIYDTHPTHDVIASVKGMFYDVLAKIDRLEKYYVKTLEYDYLSIELLKQIYCEERVNQINIDIANSLFIIGLYDEAEKNIFPYRKKLEKIISKEEFVLAWII